MSGVDKATVKPMFKRYADGPKSLFYAFGQGATMDESKFVIHKTMKANALVKSMGEKKEFKKVGFGTIKVVGTSVYVTQGKKVSKMATWLPKMLKAAGIRYLVNVDMPAPSGPAKGGGAGRTTANEEEESVQA